MDQQDRTTPLRRVDLAGSSLPHRFMQRLWRHGFRFLFVLDAAALYLAMLVINFVRVGGFKFPTFAPAHYLVGFAIAAAVYLIVNYFAGLYEREPRIGDMPTLPRVILSMAIGTAFIGLIELFRYRDRYLMPRANLVALFFVGSVLLAANRRLSLYMARRRRGPSRVLLVGNPTAIQLARDHFAQRPGRAIAHVVGEVDDVEHLLAAVHRSKPSDVLLLDLAAFDNMFPEPLSSLDDLGVGVHQRVGAHETLLGLRSVREIAGMPFTRLRAHEMSRHQAHLKRLFDITVLIATLPLVAVVLALLALYVLVFAGRPVIYRQVRMGQGNRSFTLYKFRTMTRDAERDGPQLSGHGDQRVVRGLGWMRAARADELPQVWNVVRGEMSLVGPRPERPELIAEIERVVPGYARRHFLVPGLTGLAQVQGRYDTHADYKLGYDLQYAVNWSLLLDVQILIRTIWTVVSGRV